MATREKRYDDAIELQQAGNLEGAVQQLEALAQEEPGFTLAHAALGAFYSTQGRHPEAVEHARRVCELDADDPFSYVAMSVICQRAGMMHEAEMAMAEGRNRQWAARRGGQ
jgi:predicted Zn-dependent protease